MFLNGHLSRHRYTIENREPHAAISLRVVTWRPVSVWGGGWVGESVSVCVNAKIAISCQLSPQKIGGGKDLLECLSLTNLTIRPVPAMLPKQLN